jgi:ribose transport system ATP-binding protein
MTTPANCPSNPPRLEMRDITKRFGATVALDGVSLRVPAGEVLALVGENGAGKSTLMKILSGAHRPDGGQMWLDGVPFRPANPLEARRSAIAMIYQELSLAPHLSVEENLLLGVEPHWGGWIDRRQVRARAHEALAHFAHATIHPSVLVRDLSVAARQLVEIARALAVGCRVLVLDEPTSSLTREDVTRLFALIRDLKQKGLAIVYISHFLEEVKAVSDRLVILRDGRTVGEGPTAGFRIEEVVARMVGRQVHDLYPRSVRCPGQTILEVEELAGAGKPTAASLTLRRGEVLGIAGLLGAGRTELLRCLFGLEPVRRGRIRLGPHCGPASPVRRWGQGVGFLSEDRTQEGLALSMSVADNLTLARLRGSGPAGLVFPRRQAAAARRWIQRLNIRCRGPADPVSALSGGNQQKVALARLLESDADVLLLDEPTRGIDVAAKASVYQLIDTLAAGAVGEGRRPKAVLMVSSYLPELLGVCDRVAVMHGGRLGPARPVMEWTEHALMLAAMGHAVGQAGTAGYSGRPGWEVP